MFCNNGYITMENENKAKRGKTFVWNCTYDLIFMIENVIFLIFGYTLTIESSEEQGAKNITLIISCAFHVIGILLKILYYTKLHVWSDLIHTVKKNKYDYRIFETEFRFFGTTKTITAPIIKCCSILFYSILLVIFVLFFLSFMLTSKVSSKS